MKVHNLNLKLKKLLKVVLGLLLCDQQRHFFSPQSENFPEDI